MKTSMLSIYYLLIAVTFFSTVRSDGGYLRRRLGDTFCWKDTEDRGVGTIPTQCPDGDVQLGLLCYKPCPVGYSRSGVDCHQNCPSGFTDTGLFCRLDASDYGRGGGYPWKFGDKPFHSSGQFSRCEHDHGEGNCEETGDIVYPKCKPGYHNDACCICVPDAPDCEGLGLGGNTAQSCSKKIVLGKVTIKDGCPEGKENQAGLCYKSCHNGYHGIGPVCWSNAPSGWVDCGAGDAQTSVDCASAVTSQVTSVFTSAAKIAALVIPGAEEADVADDAATDAGSAAEDGTADLKSFTKLLAAFKLLLAQKPHLQKVVDDGEAGNITPESLLSAAGLTNPADIIRFAASIANFFDPTGLSGVVAAYSYPLCSDISSH